MIWIEYPKVVGDEFGYVTHLMSITMLMGKMRLMSIVEWVDNTDVTLVSTPSIPQLYDVIENERNLRTAMVAGELFLIRSNWDTDEHTIEPIDLLDVLDSWLPADGVRLIDLK